MVTPNPLDIDLVVVFASVLITALVARATQLPITALEIIAGVALVTVLGFGLPAGTDSILILGGLFIVFLAGFETGFGFLRVHLRRALTVGLAGFLGPFVGIFLLLFYGLHLGSLVSIISASVLADTSISITYATLQQYDLTDLAFGRLVLASTLCVNLAEDFTVTAATVLTTPGLLFTIGVLGALAASAVLLPRLSKAAEGARGGQFTNIAARSLLLSLAILAFLSALVGVPGILFVFLMGLIFSQVLPPSGQPTYLANVRPMAFALFIPLYFVAVGLKVDLAFVIAHWPLVLGLAVAASALKFATLVPVVRRTFGPDRAGPVSVLMNTRLTSATVILTLTLGLGLISPGWYSVLISVVVALALLWSAMLRAFPAFQSPESARALFDTLGTDRPEDESLPGSEGASILRRRPALRASPGAGLRS